MITNALKTLNKGFDGVCRIEMLDSLKNQFLRVEKGFVEK